MASCPSLPPNMTTISSGRSTGICSVACAGQSKKSLRVSPETNRKSTWASITPLSSATLTNDGPSSSISESPMIHTRSGSTAVGRRSPTPSGPAAVTAVVVTGGVAAGPDSTTGSGSPPPALSSRASRASRGRSRNKKELMARSGDVTAIAIERCAPKGRPAAVRARACALRRDPSSSATTVARSACPAGERRRWRGEGLRRMVRTGSR